MLKFHLLPLLAALAAFLSTTCLADDSSIHSITVGPIFPVNTSNGDTWDLAWANDGAVYSPSDDTHGFHNAGSGSIMFNQITGDDPQKLDGKTVNIMADYSNGNKENRFFGPDGCTWKSSGCIALDGTLYMLVARHKYGGGNAAQRNSGAIDFDMRQMAHGASFIKSTDGGKTWTRSEQENYDHPMFPGSRFAAPYFVQYGQDGHEINADGSEKYVYALSNNGFWDNGDYVVLGRVLRSKMGNLSGADWQYYMQGDGAGDAAWTSNILDAQSVLTHPDHLGMTRAVYLPVQKCYLMIGWYYPAGGGKWAFPPNPAHKWEYPPAPAHVKTIWDFYVASHPWGPWRVIDSHTFTPQGFYSPGVCPKFSSADGSTVWAFTAGDWTNGAAYRLNAVSLSIK